MGPTVWLLRGEVGVGDSVEKKYPADWFQRKNISQGNTWHTMTLYVRAKKIHVTRGLRKKKSFPNQITHIVPDPLKSQMVGPLEHSKVVVTCASTSPWQPSFDRPVWTYICSKFGNRKWKGKVPRTIAGKLFSCPDQMCFPLAINIFPTLGQLK